jgi:hypothetical protein
MKTKKISDFYYCVNTKNFFIVFFQLLLLFILPAFIPLCNTHMKPFS